MSIEDVVLRVEGSKVPGFQAEAADAIVQEVAAGSSFQAACKAVGIPYRVAYRWRHLNVEDFAERIGSTMAQRAEYLVEEAMDAIADLAEPTANDINAARLKLNAAQWYAERLKPDRFSPTIISATRGADGKLAPVAAMVVVPPKAPESDEATHEVADGGPAE